ncbi:MAG: anthranilate phosphoribosyltransferase [Acidimicrobiaceae bacterium]|nr:anthranilate phosphoribosyltransferase [Acidimicrobiaceae bacterium]
MTTLDDYGGWPGILAILAAGRDIGTGEARAALGAILAGEATDAQIAAFIVALRIKGAAVGELQGLVGAMRDAATPLDIPADAIDIVGTGGTAGRKTHALNVSTMACFVAAGAGATVCKHGNVKASSTSGSFDLLEVIGLPLGQTPEQVAEAVCNAGLGFAFAKAFHPAMRHVAAVRSQVGIPTVFNLLGPLSHPGHAKRQVIGAPDESLAPTLAAVLQATGSVRSLVVHGDGRFDEFTTTGPNLVVELNEGKVTEYRIEATDVGLAPARPDELRGGDPVANARILASILAGEPGPKRDMVVLNAAAGLVVAGVADDLAAGVEAAAAAIDDGRAAQKFDEVTANTSAS